MGKSIRLKLGKKIRQWRNKRGFTQEKLAELSKIDYKHIQKIEGKNPPNLKVETIQRLAKALKIKPYQLLKP